VYTSSHKFQLTMEEGYACLYIKDGDNSNGGMRESNRRCMGLRGDAQELRGDECRYVEVCGVK
jgi:hypothetical protein